MEEEMIQTGVDEKLEEPVWMNKKGEVCGEENAYGRGVHFKQIKCSFEEHNY